MVRAPLHARMTFDGLVPRFGIIYPITPPLSEADCAAKRPREDEGGDLDPNPREVKRASLPPETEKGKEKKGETDEEKSGSDACAQSTPMSPKSNLASTLSCLYFDLVLCMLIKYIGRWRLLLHMHPYHLPL